MGKFTGKPLSEILDEAIKLAETIRRDSIQPAQDSLPALRSHIDTAQFEQDTKAYNQALKEANVGPLPVGIH